MNMQSILILLIIVSAAIGTIIKMCKSGGSSCGSCGGGCSSCSMKCSSKDKDKQK